MQSIISGKVNEKDKPNQDPSFVSVFIAYNCGTNFSCGMSSKLGIFWTVFIRVSSFDFYRIRILS